MVILTYILYLYIYLYTCMINEGCVDLCMAVHRDIPQPGDPVLVPSRVLDTPIHYTQSAINVKGWTWRVDRSCPGRLVLLVRLVLPVILVLCWFQLTLHFTHVFSFCMTKKGT